MYGFTLICYSIFVFSSMSYDLSLLRTIPKLHVKRDTELTTFRVKTTRDLNNREFEKSDKKGV